MLKKVNQIFCPFQNDIKYTICHLFPIPCIFRLIKYNSVWAVIYKMDLENFQFQLLYTYRYLDAGEIWK